jgi:hypothetical protein
MAGLLALFYEKRKVIFYGHACGVRVHRVQKVQRVQRVVVSPLDTPAA